MKTFLKHTTAVAAIAALPLAAQAAGQQAQPNKQEQIQSQVQQPAQQSQTSQSDYGVQSKSELVPSDKEIKTYKSQADTAPAKAEVSRTDSGEYVEQASGKAGDDAGQSTANKTFDTSASSDGSTRKGDETAASSNDADLNVGEPLVQTQTAEGFDGKDTSSGTSAGQPPAQEQMNANAGAEQGSDVLIAKVGDREIHRSDVLGVIGQLPPQLQQQPPEMLIPMALDQLVLRELILQEAQKAGLENDPEVAALVTDGSEKARENAMVQVWLDRQLANAVTDSKVNETYGAIQDQLGAEAPELEQIRPQIEEQLRRQAFNDISDDLQSKADVTVYGPDGQPMPQ